MLTEEIKYQNKMQFLDLVSKLGIDMTQLTKYLDSVDYFEKPATAQYFRSYPGGLCAYALDTYRELAQLCNAYFPGRYSQEDVIKVALFKDIYRAEMYEAYNKNIKDDATGQWSSKLAYKTKEVRPTFGDLGFSSYMIAKYFINFTDEQIEAICHCKSSEFTADLKDIQRSYPLVTLTKMADLAVYNFLED